MRRRSRSRWSQINRDTAERLIADAEAFTPGSFARLSRATGTKVIHISERDTQISNAPTVSPLELSDVDYVGRVVGEQALDSQRIDDAALARGAQEDRADPPTIRGPAKAGPFS